MNQLIIGLIVLIIIFLFIVCRRRQKESFATVDSSKMNNSAKGSEKCNMYCQDG